MPTASVNAAADEESNAHVQRAVSTEASPKVKYAVKTSLSLTLAYLIPMALGWPQPQTAAITVMLIAATGLLSESLQKGVSRLVGTVAGAIIGLSLIALFPQDRSTYLIVVSITVALITYLYNAYQGDSTVFMLTSVVTLMVFNGGDAEGAFLYGVDRAFMTGFGVAVYTVVASFLWPVRAADTTRTLAAGLASDYSGLFAQLMRQQAGTDAAVEEQLAKLLADTTALDEQFIKVKDSAGITNYAQEWDTILACYEELQIALLPALQQPRSKEDLQHYIVNYREVSAHITALFDRVEEAWQGRPASTSTATLSLEYNVEGLRERGHLHTAKVVGHGDMLATLQAVLVDLEQALHSLLFDVPGFVSKRKPRARPTFVWLDLENFKTSLRALTAFWIATALWMEFNPPGGFVFVTLCTILIPMVSYTPVTPKLLTALLTLSFLFAVPAYVFLLPQMTHWLELGLFLFVYAFIGLYLFPGPVALFFLLGLFTLGIQNDMRYNFDVIALIVLMFYITCATILIALYFPFTSRPEKIYASLQGRFFSLCARKLNIQFDHLGQPIVAKIPATLRLESGPLLLEKMGFWGAKIDPAFFPANDQKKIGSLNSACKLLLSELHILERHRTVFAANPLILATHRTLGGNALSSLCLALAQGNPDQVFSKSKDRVAEIEKCLDQVLGEDHQHRYDQHQLAQFYVYLNLQISIVRCIEKCRANQQSMDWQQLAETRF